MPTSGPSRWWGSHAWGSGLLAEHQPGQELQLVPNQLFLGAQGVGLGLGQLTWPGQLGHSTFPF